MRIIGGEFRSRKIAFPSDKSTRPMTDKNRETIFNVLGETVAGAEVLDLFAGSGSMGLEALSRGAAEIVFVEDSLAAQKTILENVKRLGLGGKIRLLALDALDAVKILEKHGKKFTLIFLDPPYCQGLVKKVLNALDRSVIVPPHSQLIVHRARQEELPEGLQSIQLLREKKIGQACLSFLSGKEA